MMEEVLSRKKTYRECDLSNSKDLRKEEGKNVEDTLISIIIPLYNEEDAIKNVLERIPNHGNYEIIVVDDGSSDNSSKRVMEVNDKRVKMFEHKENKGYGATLLTGIENATCDIIVTMDSDGQHYPEEIPVLVEPIINKEADVVIGSRYLGKCHYKLPLYTKVGEKVISYLLWLFYGQKVENNQCGFRAFTKSSKHILKEMTQIGMGFSTEFLFKACSYGLNLKEVPIRLKPRVQGVSKVNLMKIIISISKCILKYFYKIIVNPKKNTAKFFKINNINIKIKSYIQNEK